MASRELCSEHTGLVERMNALEKENDAQWKKLRIHDNRIDGMITRINIALGGIAASCILLAINIWLNSKGIK